jgi:quercetin dioxygenase-like cupin family protein
MIKNFYFADKDAVETVLPNGIKRRVLAHVDNLMVCEIHFKKDMVGALHTHVHEQITYIISGKFEFSVGDQKYVVSAGDTIYKQPNIIHGAICLEDGVLLDIFTPERKDFL